MLDVRLRLDSGQRRIIFRDREQCMAMDMFRWCGTDGIRE